LTGRICPFSYNFAMAVATTTVRFSTLSLGIPMMSAGRQKMLLGGSGGDFNVGPKRLATGSK
jgi:hypothetical protein